MVQVPSDASDSGNSRFEVERRGLRLGQRDAGFADHHVGVDVDLADRAQALGRDDDLLAAHVRNLSAHQTGVAALGNHADPRLVAEGGDGCDFAGRAGPHQRERLAMIEPARLDERAGEQGRVGQHVARAHDLLQGGENGVAFRCVHLEEPPRARFRSCTAKDGGDFDMGGKAELVKRGDGVEPESRRRRRRAAEPGRRARLSSGVPATIRTHCARRPLRPL